MNPLIDLIMHRPSDLKCDLAFVTAVFAFLGYRVNHRRHEHRKG